MESALIRVLEGGAVVGAEHFGLDIVLVEPRSYDMGMPWGFCYSTIFAGLV